MKRELNPNIGSNIRRIRLSQRVKQRDVAERCNISINYLSQIESSRKVPSEKALQCISKELNVSLDTLYEESPIIDELRALIDINGLDSVLESIERLKKEIHS